MHTSATLPAIDVDRVATCSPASGTVLLDVREYDEWMAGHAPQATHIPMSELPARLGELPTGTRLACICRSGGRSRQVTAWLARQGFDAVDVTGGMQQWAVHGHPVVNHAGNAGTVI